MDGGRHGLIYNECPEERYLAFNELTVKVARLCCQEAYNVTTVCTVYTVLFHANI